MNSLNSPSNPELFSSLLSYHDPVSNPTLQAQCEYQSMPIEPQDVQTLHLSQDGIENTGYSKESRALTDFSVKQLTEVSDSELKRKNPAEIDELQKQLEKLQSRLKSLDPGNHSKLMEQRLENIVQPSPKPVPKESPERSGQPVCCTANTYGTEQKQINVKELFETSTSWDGSELSKAMFEAAAKEGGKVTVADITIQPGAKLPMHYHPHLMVARYISGPGITIVTESGNTVRLDKDNPFIVELINTNHYGFNPGETATQLSVTRIGPKDQPHTTIVKDQVH